MVSNNDDEKQETNESNNKKMAIKIAAQNAALHKQQGIKISSKKPENDKDLDNDDKAKVNFDNGQKKQATAAPEKDVGFGWEWLGAQMAGPLWSAMAGVTKAVLGKIGKELKNDLVKNITNDDGSIKEPKELAKGIAKTVLSVVTGIIPAKIGGLIKDKLQSRKQKKNEENQENQENKEELQGGNNDNVANEVDNDLVSDFRNAVKGIKDLQSEFTALVKKPGDNAHLTQYQDNIKNSFKRINEEKKNISNALKQAQDGVKGPSKKGSSPHPKLQ